MGKGPLDFPVGSPRTRRESEERGGAGKLMNGNKAATGQMIELKAGETALVGYGSLLSIPSLERTLGRTYTGPFLRCVVRGWRRTWDAAMPNERFYTEGADGRMTPEAILYLNVRRDAS